MKLSEVMSQGSTSPKMKLSEVMAQEPEQAIESEQAAEQPKSIMDKINDVVLSAPGGKELSELAASANKSIFQMIDFLGADNVNAVLDLVGSDKKVPTLSENLASDGGYMEEGLGRDIVQTAGKLVPVAASMAPAVGRNLASAKGATQELLGVGSARPTSASLVAEGKEAGIPVLTSDAIPPKTFPGKIAQQTAEKIPVAGTAPVRETQQVMRQKAVQDIADKYGEFSYEAIIKSLKSQKNRVKNAAGSVLEKTGKQLDDFGPAPTTNTQKAISEASEELSKPGVINSSSAGDDLSTLVEALQEPQTFTTLKENRTAFREIVNSTDKADRSQLTSRAKALLTKVEKGLSDDMESFAKTNLSEKEFSSWKRANAVYAEQAKSLSKTKLKNILDKGDITPETVSSMLFSKNPSEQKLLYQSLTNSGKSHARSAIISKVVNDISKRQAGFTPNAFSTELKKYGGQVDVFFKGADKRQLTGLQRVLEATRRAQDATVTTPTGQQLIGGLSVTGLYLDPVAALGTAGTLGGLARIYESAPVRNALLKLGSAPKRSDTYLPALLAAQVALNDAVEQEAGKQSAKQ